MTTWTADCGCKVSYDHEPHPKGGDNIHFNFKTQNTCVRHAHHAKCEDRYLAMLDDSCDKQSIPRHHRKK